MKYGNMYIFGESIRIELSLLVGIRKTCLSTVPTEKPWPVGPSVVCNNKLKRRRSGALLLSYDGGFVRYIHVFT